MTILSLIDHLRERPFELILSSGFFGFFAHTGVVHALEEAALLPSAVGGSSAGALVAGLWGAGIPAEVLRERLFALRRTEFWDPDPLLGLAARRPGLLRGERFAAILDEMLATVGATRFDACKVPVRVVVFDVRARHSVVLSDGPLAPAIRASCSVPGMFQPVAIDGRLYLDGGIADRAGLLAASSATARVLYHHLPASSPWRRLTRVQSGMPRRADLFAFTEPRLPRLGPTRLERGPLAFELGRSATLRALDAPVPSDGDAP